LGCAAPTQAAWQFTSPAEQLAMQDWAGVRAALTTDAAEVMVDDAA